MRFKVGDIVKVDNCFELGKIMKISPYTSGELVVLMKIIYCKKRHCEYYHKCMEDGIDNKYEMLDDGIIRLATKKELDKAMVENL